VCAAVISYEAGVAMPVLHPAASVQPSAGLQTLYMLCRINPMSEHADSMCVVPIKQRIEHDAAKDAMGTRSAPRHWSAQSRH
jgi:hypothetical protein